MAAIEAIVGRGRPPSALSEERFALARYMGYQLTRSVENRDRLQFPQRVVAFAAGRDIGAVVVTEFLRDRLAFAPDPAEVAGTLRYMKEALQGDPGDLVQKPVAGYGWTAVRVAAHDGEWSAPASYQSSRAASPVRLSDTKPSARQSSRRVLWARETVARSVVPSIRS
jgi:hypothetical protein